MKRFGTPLKLLATVAIFAYVLFRVDPPALLARLGIREISLALLAGVATVFVQTAIASIRLRACVIMLGREVSKLSAWVACQLGGIFSHTPISFVGGDVMRAWHLSRCGVPLEDSAKAVIIDRVIGLAGLLCLALATASSMFNAIAEPALAAAYTALIAIFAGGLVAFVVFGALHGIRFRLPVLRKFSDFASLSRYIAVHPRLTLETLGLAVLMNALNVVAIWLISLAYGGEVSALQVAIAGPAAFLVATIPISVAGWGLREGAIVAAFAVFGIPSDLSLTISITYGIAVLLAYSPAVVLLLVNRGRYVVSESAAMTGYSKGPNAGPKC